jgi:hypothetical protein
VDVTYRPKNTATTEKCQRDVEQKVAERRARSTDSGNKQKHTPDSATESKLSGNK